MVKTVNTMLPMSSDHVDTTAWLAKTTAHFPPEGIALIRNACALAEISLDTLKTSTGASALTQAIELANRLLRIEVDYESVAAALAYSAAQEGGLGIDDITERLGKRVAKLVSGVLQMDAINIFNNQISNQQQINTMREMLLTMVDDIRVVLIKLAERCCIMQAMEFRGAKEQHHVAEETRHIYAPLASRLGIYEIKWELEDLAFRYLDTEQYRLLAKQINETRNARENYVTDFMQELSDLLDADNVTYEINGRAKHIYSIHKKMQRKKIDYSTVYDAIAVRVLVNNIEDCYKVLSVVHNQWDHVPSEFDDYIATPKANGYQSIHTVAIGPSQKYIEIQIRTHKMHEENELGVAAHWLYKEGSAQSAYDRKIAWLRELLAWEKELCDASELPDHLKQNLEADRVFVFTPNSDLIALPFGSTPLDFAYHVHSEIGHRCKGAKVDGKIVPLTYHLKTGDRVEILTGKIAQPSRDWLSPHSGYLNSPRARAKVFNWFNRQDQESHFNAGQILVDKEFKKRGLRDVDLSKIAKKLHIKSSDNLFIGLGSGEITLDDVLKIIEQEAHPVDTAESTLPTIRTTKLDNSGSGGIMVEGVGDLLTHLAGCCKPLPGDEIVGYVTHGHGITIHRTNCDNITHLNDENKERILSVSWGKTNKKTYPVDIYIEALDRSNLLHDVTAVLSQAKIHLVDLSTKTDHKNHCCRIYAQLAINDLEVLNHTLTQLQQLANIYEVKRI